MALEIYILQRIKKQNMKTINMPLFLIAVSYLLMAAGCKKDNPQSELVTVNGQTFGCRVNGKPFIDNRWDYGNNVPPIFVTMLYNPVLRYSYLIASGDRQNEMVEIYIPSPLTVGRKNLQYNTLSYPTIVNPLPYGLYRTYTPSQDFITNDTLGGYVDILFADTVTRKIEGKFEFTGTDNSTGQRVTITNGYFKNF